MSIPASTEASSSAAGGLVQRAQAGDREALHALLREHQDVWFRFSVSILRDSERAQDATQETAVRVMTGLSRFAGRSTFKTWSLGIALNVCRTLKRERRPLSLAEPTERAASPEPPPDWEVHELLEGLPPRQREVIVLRYFEELTVEEAAKVMGCRPGTVKATTHQALQALRERWKDGAS